jgi:hypothetical protein
MQPRSKFPRQSLMHRTRPRHARHARKPRRNHMHGIMRLTARARASMARMAGAVIGDFKQGGLEARFQGLPHTVRALGHGVFFRACDFFAKPYSALRLGATTPIKP